LCYFFPVRSKKEFSVMPLLFWLRCAIALLVPLAAVTAAAQPVMVERDTPLYAEARLDSPVVANLKKGTAGEAVAKSGAWINLKTPGAAGWLFSFNVRFASAQPGAEAGGASVLGRLVGPRENVNVTSAMGVRGIGEEDLRQARFNGDQLKLLDRYAVSKADAESSAQASGLNAARVDYFDGQSR
jgi:hypothetical protein